MGPSGPPIVQHITSEKGRLALTVETEPNPPVRGLNAVSYTITNMDSSPADGLRFTVIPWMPAHAHGTSVEPQIEPRGEGRYRISNVLFYMPGRWQLQTQFAGDDDHATPEFQIP